MVPITSKPIAPLESPEQAAGVTVAVAFNRQAALMVKQSAQDQKVPAVPCCQRVALYKPEVASGGRSRVPENRVALVADPEIS